MKFLTLMLVASVFLGAELLAIPLGIAQLSAYRMMIVIVALVSLKKVVVNDPSTEISFSDKLNFYHFVYFSWLIYALFSIIWVESISRWVFGVFFILTGVFSIFAISFYLNTRKDLNYLFNIVLVMTGLHQLLGWYEVITNNYIWKANRFGSAITTFGNVNDYATLLLAGLFVGLLVLLTNKNNWVRLYCLTHIFSGFLLLNQGGSRANQLGLILGILVIVAIKLFDLKLSRQTFHSIIGLIIGFMLLLILSPTIRDNTIHLLDRFMNTFFASGSNRYRVNLILNGIIFLFQTYGFGVGAGNIEYWMAQHAVIRDIDVVNMHNWFMEILVGYGVVIFLLYVLMYIYIVRQLFINYKYSTDSYIRNVSLVLLAYVIAFIVSSMSSASNIFIEWQWVFWGIIITFIQYTERYKYNENKFDELIIKPY